MPNDDQRPISLPLGEVKRRLQRWRGACRGPGGRVPNELQRLAAQAASAHGLKAAAEQLHVKPERLEKWMRQFGLDRGAAGPAPVEFIELPPLPLGGLPGALAECHLEVEEPSGRKLRLCLKGAAAAQAASLLSALWGEARR